MPIGNSAAKPAPTATNAEYGRLFKDVPSGKYKLWLNKANAGVSKNGVPRVRFGWCVADGDMKGEWVWESTNLQNDRGWEVLAKKIHAVCPEFDLPLWWGAPAERFAEVQEQLQQELNDVLEYLKVNRRSLHQCTVKVNDKNFSTVFVD